MGSRFARRHLIVGAALIVVVAVLVAAIADPFGNGRVRGRTVNDGGTGLTRVVRESLSSQTASSGTLGFAGSYSVINEASGTLTWLPGVGTIIPEGETTYRVDGAPVVLLTGKIPFYRALWDGMTGADVEQLNHDLVALGYARSAELSPTSDDFSGATVDALEALQRHLGVAQTGTLALGQAVFLPLRRGRVTAVHGTLGANAGPGSQPLTVSSARRLVSLQLDAAEQSDVTLGDHVTIALPDNADTPGVISSIGTVASAGTNGGSPTVPVSVRPSIRRQPGRSTRRRSTSRSRRGSSSARSRCRSTRCSRSPAAATPSRRSRPPGATTSSRPRPACSTTPAGWFRYTAPGSRSDSG
jgi:hypothetical protein